MTAPALTDTITVDTMRPKLLTLDDARNRLAATEPIQTQPFTVGESVKFIVNEGWNDKIAEKSPTDLVDAFVRVPNGDTLQLTKEAILEAGARAHQQKAGLILTPGWLVQSTLNYWYQGGLAGKDYQLLITGGTVSALTKSTLVPFSNLRILDEVVEALEAKYGFGEILVDYKLNHSLRNSYVRLILPNVARDILNSGTDNDTWSLGVRFRNSLTGEKQTEVAGYLFRWWCTNGATSTHDSGIWSRKSDGQDPAEMYAWARRSVDEVLGGLEGALDDVQRLTEIDLTGNMSSMANGVFDKYKVPLAERGRITDSLLDQDNMTMYSLMQAVTESANDTSMDSAAMDRLLRVGGEIPHLTTSRCDLGQIHIGG